MAPPPPTGKPTYLAHPSKPKLKLPPGSWDTHCHIFGPQSRFPFPADRKFTPADAPKEKLFALHDLLGIERCVIVQSGAHGFDNSPVEDALKEKNGVYLGVALAPVDVPDAKLKRLDTLGFRGVRFNYMAHLGKAADLDDVLALAKRFAPLGWHLQIHPDASIIGPMSPQLLRSPVPVVIDHMARIDASKGFDQPGFVALSKLMEDERFWVKVSGCDRATAMGPPYDDAVPFAAKLVADFPDRVVWGSDWPHPNHRAPIPDDGELVDLIARIAPSEAARQKLMVDNPVRLYRPRS